MKRFCVLFYLLSSVCFAQVSGDSILQIGGDAPAVQTAWKKPVGNIVTEVPLDGLVGFWRASDYVDPGIGLDSYIKPVVSTYTAPDGYFKSSSEITKPSFVNGDTLQFSGVPGAVPALTASWPFVMLPTDGAMSWVVKVKLGEDVDTRYLGNSTLTAGWNYPTARVGAARGNANYVLGTEGKMLIDGQFHTVVFVFTADNQFASWVDKGVATAKGAMSGSPSVWSTMSLGAYANGSNVYIKWIAYYSRELTQSDVDKML